MLVPSFSGPGFNISLRLLLERGGDANVQRYGQTPLHFCAAHGGRVGEQARAAFAALLLDHGARLDGRDELLASTPLGWACRYGRRPLVELFLARGARADEGDAEPWATPRAWARRHGHAELLDLL